tara:strand:+ start:245 stop:1234 length:990 start_codon:yes stop_codon:yes gene_type:complete
MVKNKNLSICIPTFNRPDLLKKNLLLMLPEINKFYVSIYISDDSSNNETSEMINYIQKKYKYLFYIRNKPSLGHDKNFLHSLTLPETEYVWLLGDSIFLKKDAIRSILKVINQYKPDIIGVNALHRDLDINSAYYNNCHSVLNDFGWHLTLTGASIYSKMVISNIKEIELHNCKNFPQISLIFNSLSKRCSFYWLNNKLIFTGRTNKDYSYWLNNVFQVFIDDFSKSVCNLPRCYRDIDKEKVIVNHSLKTKLFALKNLLQFRILDIYNYKSYRKYSRKLVIYSRLSNLSLIFIAFMPKFIIGFLLKIYTSLNILLLNYFRRNSKNFCK